MQAFFHLHYCTVIFVFEDFTEPVVLAFMLYLYAIVGDYLGT